MRLIEVSHLTKRYGAHEAVSDLTFSIEKGRVYGFLGPNGAGKSTTMNIITGCLGPTAGEVRIGGASVLDEPLKARRLVGYLPEQPPVYGDMTPEEYLRFVARAKGVPKEKREAQINAVMDRTKLHDVKDRLIANLSKGYRQRVGIAQALLGEPEVIILDEPTVGLDPKQIIEIRELIRELGREHTIVLSSHILSEVQVVCDEILILSRGRLVARGTADELERMLSGARTLSLTVKADEAAARAALANLPGVAEAAFAPGDAGETRVTLSPEEGADVREAAFYRLAEAKAPILEMTRASASLEDVFLELTNADAPDISDGSDASDGADAAEKAPEERATEDAARGGRDGERA